MCYKRQENTVKCAETLTEVMSTLCTEETVLCDDDVISFPAR